MFYSDYNLRKLVEESHRLDKFHHKLNTIYFEGLIANTFSLHKILEKIEREISDKLGEQNDLLRQLLEVTRSSNEKAQTTSRKAHKSN